MCHKRHLYAEGRTEIIAHSSTYSVAHAVEACLLCVFAKVELIMIKEADLFG